MLTVMLLFVWCQLKVRFVLQLVEPQEATQEMLGDVHTEEYLQSVNESGTRLAEVQI